MQFYCLASKWGCRLLRAFVSCPPSAPGTSPALSRPSCSLVIWTGQQTTCFYLTKHSSSNGFKSLSNTNSLSPHRTPTMWVLLLALFYVWGVETWKSQVLFLRTHTGERGEPRWDWTQRVWLQAPLITTLKYGRLPCTRHPALPHLSWFHLSSKK